MARFLVVCMMIASVAVPGQALEVVSPKAIYQVGPSTRVNVDKGLYAHELIITDPSGQLINRMRWIDHADHWDRGFVYKDKLVLVGTLGTISNVVSVLNTASKQPMLFVLCRTPSFSPSGRYVGYLQFKPRHTTDPLDDIVLTLDLDNLPAIEPSGAGWVIDSTNVGTAIYPRAYIGKKEFYVVVEGDNPWRNYILPPKWDTKRDVIAVVEKVGDQWSLVAVDLTARIDQRKLMEQRLDVRQFLLEQSNDPVVIQRLQEKLRINYIDVEDGIASIAAVPITDIPLRTVVVPLR